MRARPPLVRPDLNQNDHNPTIEVLAMRKNQNSFSLLPVAALAIAFVLTSFAGSSAQAGGTNGGVIGDRGQHSASGVFSGKTARGNHLAGTQHRASRKAG